MSRDEFVKAPVRRLQQFQLRKGNSAASWKGFFNLLGQPQWLHTCFPFSHSSPAFPQYFLSLFLTIPRVGIYLRDISARLYACTSSSSIIIIIIDVIRMSYPTTYLCCTANNIQATCTFCHNVSSVHAPT
jgi:hypothetical protein